MTKSRGFALVLVLSLLAILVLVVYAISTVGKVSGSISSAAVYQTQARQNALVAMRYGLGQLQRYAGPDERMTAMAGVVGIAAGNSLRQLTGVWGDDIEPIWLVSNAGTGGVPSINGNKILLVGLNSVGTDTGLADQEIVEAGLVAVPDATNFSGHIAFWVGDEGGKISTVVPDAEVQTSSSTGRLLRPDIKRVLEKPTFMPDAAELAGLISFEQLPNTQTAKGASIKGAFHSATLSHRALPTTVPGGSPATTGYIKGAININTTSVAAWRALLEYPDRSNTAYGLSQNSTSNNAIKITARIAAHGSPFRSVADFYASGIVQDAFASLPNRISSMTAQEFVDDLAPILAVRSDTFRIRAYGDAMNPADAGDANAKPEAVAYCEAIVQRTNQDDPGGHGKKFVITYFRWLGPDDI